jgi:4-hydroxybenzoate polyprenyltransferase
MISLGKIHALLATARIANVPSVICNVWLGIAIGAFFGGWDSFSEPWSAAVRLSLAGVLLYISGNFLNDWADLAWDRQHRPERALPRGLFSRQLYLAVAIGCGAGGFLLAAITRLPAAAVALAILAAVVTYTHWHKRSPWAVIAMGSCRALLPVMGAVGFSGVFQRLDRPLDLRLPGGEMFQIDAGSFATLPHGIALVACAFGLFCHIAGLSLSARYESLPHPPQWISRTSRALFVATALVVSAAAYGMAGRLDFVILGALPYIVWVALSLSIWRKPVPRHISRLLAGIPWVDAMMLVPLALVLAPAAGFWMEPFAAACFFLPPLAFVLALVLQRLAPAT